MQITITVSPAEMLELLSGINGNININSKAPTEEDIRTSIHHMNEWVWPFMRP